MYAPDMGPVHFWKKNLCGPSDMVWVKALGIAVSYLLKCSYWLSWHSSAGSQVGQFAVEHRHSFDGAQFTGHLIALIWFVDQSEHTPQLLRMVVKSAPFTMPLPSKSARQSRGSSESQTPHVESMIVMSWPSTTPSNEMSPVQPHN